MSACPRRRISALSNISPDLSLVYYHSIICHNILYFSTFADGCRSRLTIIIFEVNFISLRLNPYKRKMAKAERYGTAKGATNTGLDELSRKLADDLRSQIRRLGSVPMFSDEWFDMANVFGRIANVSDMESKLAEGKEDKTLWETEEQALRFLMEDGKLNLCLRNLVEFKLHQRRARILGSGPIFDFSTECDSFERGLGIVLKNAWMHVEAIQTTDLPTLLTHIADTLDGALDVDEDLMSHCAAGDVHQRQEMMVFHYLYCIMRQLEQIKESRVMPLVRERMIFMQGLRVIEKVYRFVLSAHIMTSLTALALLVESEDFSTYTDQYITSAADVAFLVSPTVDFLASLRSPPLSLPSAAVLVPPSTTLISPLPPPLSFHLSLHHSHFTSPSTTLISPLPPPLSFHLAHLPSPPTTCCFTCCTRKRPCVRWISRLPASPNSALD